MDGTLDTVAYSDVSPSSVFARVIYVSSNITFCRTISCLSVVHCVLPFVASSSSTPVVNPSTCGHTVFYLSCFRLRMSRIYLSGNKHIHILIMIPGGWEPLTLAASAPTFRPRLAALTKPLTVLMERSKFSAALFPLRFRCR